MEARKLGLSLLEKKAITTNTEQNMDLNKRDITDTEVDQVVTDYFNYLFTAGHPAHRGDKIIASLMHFRSHYSRMGSGKLRRCWRALKGWRQLSPGQSRRAMPLSVWSGISMELVRMGQLRIAIFLMVGLSSYSRPSELIRCRLFSLVRPTRGINDHWCLLLSPGAAGEVKDGGSSTAAFPSTPST